MHDVHRLVIELIEDAEASASDILYTPFFTGIPGNYLKASISAAGLDPANLPQPDSGASNFGSSRVKPWKDIWGAGQGVGAIKRVVPAAELEAAPAGFRFVSVDALPPLAFDHADIVAAAVTRLRGKSSYSTLPFFLLPERFTLTELQRTYEAILQTTLEKSNFRRKMEAWDVLEATDDYALGAQRPARLYSLKDFALFDRSVG